MEMKVAIIAGIFALVAAVIGSLLPLIYTDMMATKSKAYTLLVETSDKARAGTDDTVTFHLRSNGRKEKFDFPARGTLFERPSNGGEGVDLLTLSSNLDFPIDQISISMKNITKHAGWNPVRLLFIDESTSEQQCYIFKNLWVGGSRGDQRLPPRSRWLDPMPSTDGCKDMLEHRLK